MRKSVLLLIVLVLTVAGITVAPLTAARGFDLELAAQEQQTDAAPLETQPKHRRLPNASSPTGLVGYHAPSGTADSTACTLLIVDDDWDYSSLNGGGRPYYTSTLDKLGFNYGVWDTVSQGDPTAGDMANYDVVIWFTGYAWEGGVFAPENEAQVGQFLGSGGSFVLSSQDYYDDAQQFNWMQDYLGIDPSTVHEAVLTTTVGIAGNPIGDGLGPYTMARPDDWDVYWPTGQEEGPTDDKLEALPGVGEPFRYVDPPDNPSNSTNFDGGGFKTVYLGWPFEWIDTIDQRAEIMGAILPWLDCTSPVDLTPPRQEESGVPDATVVYDLTLINNLDHDETFDITYDAVWTTTGPSTVGPLPSGGSEDFQVTVTVPSDAGCFETDMATVIATAQTAPYDSDTATLETSAEPADIGSVSGTVFDANTGLGIPAAHIQLTLDVLSYDTNADGDGIYSIADIPACTYDGLFSATGYYSQGGVPVPVVADQTVDFPISLDASLPAVSTEPVRVDLLPGGAEAVMLTLSNNGTGDLLFQIAELPNGGLVADAPDTGKTMPTGVDPQVYAELASAVVGVPERGARFLVFMAEQADLSAAFGIEDRSARGQYVLNTLKATSERSQADLRNDLASKGIPHQSRYVANALVVEVPPSMIHGDVAGTSAFDLVESIAIRPDVAHVAPITAVPLELPLPSSAAELQPGVGGKPEVQYISWGITHTHAISVWEEYEALGQDIVVASIDTGVSYIHESLSKTYRGWLDGTGYDHNHNWWDPYGLDPAAPRDGSDHGTPVMGAMVGNDRPANPIQGNYVIGMSPNSTWFTCQGFSARGTGPAYADALLECAEFVLAPWDLNGENPNPDLRADVVNNSWSIGQGQWWFNQVIYAWRAAGIFSVFAAGDGGPTCGTASSPGDLVGALSVGATDVDDTIASFSARGPAAFTGLTKPDITAPGVDIFLASSGGNYAWDSSTSFASPHVAGEVALIWSAVPDLRGNVGLTEQIIAASAVPIPDGQCGAAGPPNSVYGQGRIDALEAVSIALIQEWDIPWLEVVPEGGTVVPSASLDITLNFDSTGLPPVACYSGALEFAFNDPYLGQATIPVEMCVTECDPGPPAAPILDAIANGDGDGDYLVNWHSVPCADSYTLEEDDNPSFASPSTRYSGTASQFQITGQAAGTWYYRVRATNADGDSLWSNTESVVVQEPPLDAPELSPISNPDGDGEYLVDWSDVTGATSYTLEEDEDPIFASPVTIYSGASTQHQITGQAGGTWHYRVRASSGAGASPWSNVESVNVLITTYLPLVTKDGQVLQHRE